MLFDEDPAMVWPLKFNNHETRNAEDDMQLVRSTMANFHIDTDKIAIGRINESLSTLQQARDLRLREAESALKSMFFPNFIW